MKATWLMGFAGVLSLVPDCEGVMGRPREAGVTGYPQILYRTGTVQDNARRASEGLANEYHVTATMADLKWKKFAMAISESLAGYENTVYLPDQLVNIGRISEMKVLDGLVIIHTINVTSNLVIDTIDLSLEIPKVSVTANSSRCVRNLRKTKCVVVVTIEKLSFELQAIWPAIWGRLMSSAEIKRYNVGSIQLNVTAPDYRGNSTTIDKTSSFWRGYVSAIKSGLRRRGIINALVKDFLNDILL